MAHRWSEETTLKFVSEYIRFTCLWDMKHVKYKNKHARQTYYKSIMKTMGIDGFGVTDVVTKIKNIRSTYSQELKKIKNAKLSGSYYIPTVRWFPKLHEALNSVEGADSTDVVDNNMDSIDITSPWSPQQNSNPMEESNVENVILPELSDSEIVEEQVYQPPKKKKHKSIDSDDILTMIGQQLSKKASDKLDSASSYWVAVLRTLPGTQQACAIKMINEVLFEAQFGNLSRQTKLLCYTSPDVISDTVKRT